MEEGLSRTEAFVSLTNMDEENVFLSLFAKTVSNAKLVAKVNRLAFDDVMITLTSEASFIRNISQPTISAVCTCHAEQHRQQY